MELSKIILELTTSLERFLGKDRAALIRVQVEKMDSAQLEILKQSLEAIRVDLSQREKKNRETLSLAKGTLKHGQNTQVLSAMHQDETHEREAESLTASDLLDSLTSK